MPSSAVEQVITPPQRDLGDGFVVRRVLPTPARRMVGPFVFLDQMGPAHFAPGQGLDVRPHPHIGLDLVTWLFEGEIVHRDSLGSVQPIRSGEVNWMTAGSGIVHSERTGPEVRAAGGALFGLQAWIALPVAHEETAPGFAHFKADAIPVAEGEGVRVTVVAGATDGIESPVRTFSDLIYADVAMDDGACWRPATRHRERGLYVIDGRIGIAGDAFAAGQFVVLRPDVEAVVRASGPARVMLVGGEPFGEARHLEWNLVSSRRDRVEQAKADWREGRFAAVPGETEFIPLPPDPPSVAYP